MDGTLVSRPYAGRLKSNEHAMVVDMTKSLVTPANILLTLKENNENNVTKIKQVYNVRYAYKRSLRESGIEKEQLMQTRLNFSNMSSCASSSSELFIQQEFDVILNHFKEVDW